MVALSRPCGNVLKNFAMHLVELTKLDQRTARPRYTPAKIINLTTESHERISGQPEVKTRQVAEKLKKMRGFKHLAKERKRERERERVCIHVTMNIQLL